VIEVFGEVYIEKLAKLFKILGDANRLRILLVIGKNERSVSEVIKATGLSQTLVSFHLKALRDAGVVTAERQGAFIYYRLVKPGLLDLVDEFRGYTSEEAIMGAEKREFSCLCLSVGKNILKGR